MASEVLLELQPSNRSPKAPANITSCEGALEAWDLLYRVLPGFVITICFFGLLGNLLVLSFFLLPWRQWWWQQRQRQQRLTIAEIYLANLAASDLVFVLGLPFWAENIGNRFNWPFGTDLCRVVSGVIKANLFVSIFLVVAISQDRYRLLVYPMTSWGHRRRRQAQATCLLIWVAGGLLSIPTFLLRSVKVVPDLNVSACILLFPHEAWHFARMVELNVLGFLLPGTAIIFFNYHILASLRGQKEANRTRCGGPKGSKTTGLILTLVASFLVCWCPYHFFAFLDFLVQVRVIQDCSWKELTDLGLQLANFFAFVNSCLNPLIYVFAGRLLKTRVLGTL
ncbi:B1 bradykinin receptor [Rattus rattus]|uniref:B1 bradykinin receptor n=1 Tax=Rattus rattus TaxID=10117 RepID=UPI0013F2C4B1|nr:B1 bradykinin receptor [Rattus rattus]